MFVDDLLMVAFFLAAIWEFYACYKAVKNYKFNKDTTVFIMGAFWYSFILGIIFLGIASEMLYHPLEAFFNGL
ncbi:hypothetical protein ACLJJ6_10515 [Pediococcus siamensis]|uniref:hypothetical protein n=1 Tax=Pediococcus siamensis TaxID=381829 RepID=UPI0039A10C1E